MFQQYSRAAVRCYPQSLDKLFGLSATASSPPANSQQKSDRAVVPPLSFHDSERCESERCVMCNLVGRQFDHLLVLGRSPAKGAASWVCRCSCGSTAIIQEKLLRNGWISSCGCRGEHAPEYYEAIAAIRSASAHQLMPAYPVVTRPQQGELFDAVGMPAC